MSLQVNLTKPIKTAEIATVEILEMIDRPNVRVVDAVLLVGGQRRFVTLWHREAYDAIGQWTDAQAVARINELLTAPPPPPIELPNYPPDDAP